MRVKVICIMLILLSVVVVATPYRYESLDIDLSITASFEIVPKSSGYFVEYVTANLQSFPRETDYQKVTRLETSGTLTSKGYTFSWNNPKSTLLNYSLDSTIRVYNFPSNVREKVKYPTPIPAEYASYVRASEHIDSNNEKIRAQASRIVEGEDDLFIALFKLASWVEDNVEYDLSSLTADVSQKASWVLNNRVGVCDEMTSLFIAMTRSLGIPAKFVSGVSYTNDERFENAWQAHGWAEVYVPGTGWVPFDPTFGEYGYVDATHVKLQESVDPEQPATRYEWVGSIDVLPLDINFDAKIVSHGPLSTPSLDINVEPVKEHVKFGSYNVVRATLTNLQPNYMASTLSLQSSDEIQIFEKKKHVVFKPFEVKEVNWLVKVQNDLTTNYLYKFPIIVYNEQNVSSSSEFEVEKHGLMLTKSQAQDLAGYRQELNDESIRLDCDYDKSFRLNETSRVVCRSEGKVCINNVCQNEMLISHDDVGVYQLKVQSFKGNVSRTIFLPYEVIDVSVIEISNVTLPQSVNYDDTFTLSFILRKGAVSTPQNVTVLVQHPNFEKVFTIDSLNSNQKIKLDGHAKYLREGNNTINVNVEWSEGQSTSITSITLKDLTFVQKIKSFFISLVGRIKI